MCVPRAGAATAQAAGTEMAPLRWARERIPLERPMSSLVRILLAIFLPPVAVLLTTGFGLQFLLNILLWVLGWLPGTVHALWLMNRERPLM
jgi:uncharacterized membrane protein YqaE (UPF0057 family)